MKPLKINLDTSRSPRAFKDGESFWQPQVDSMLALLEEHRVLYRDRQGIERHKFAPLAITILGERGSGKSSLLRTLERQLEHQDDVFYRIEQIDPTQLSPYDNFLHAFVARLLEEIELEAEKRGQELHELSCRKPLQKLADHLWAANGTAPKEEDDPVAAGLERLDRHRSGPLLKRYLHEFLDAVSEDLGRMKHRDQSRPGLFLILPIDDPDMAFDHFTRTLELYRRYLRHPRLIPIFAFSKKLAGELLTLHFGHHFGYERKRIDNGIAFRAQVEELADQFLDKYLPPRGRIVLELPQRQVLGAKLVREPRTENRYPAHPLDLDENEHAPIAASRLLAQASQVLFGRDDLTTVLLPDSLRRVLQLLDLLELRLTNDDKAPDPSGSETLFLNLARDVIQVHQAALGRRGITPETVYAMSLEARGPRLLAQVLNALEQEHPIPRWSEGRLDGLLLGLLATSAFRPSQEPAPALLNQQPQHQQTAVEPAVDQPTADQREDSEAPAITASVFGLHWLLRLLLGFYLPLRLFGSQPNDTQKDCLRGPNEGSDREARKEDGQARRDKPSRRLAHDPQAWGLGRTPQRLLNQSLGQFPGYLFIHPGGTIRLAASADDDQDIEVGAFSNPRYEHAWTSYSCWPWLFIREGNLVSESIDSRQLDPFPGLSGLLNLLSPRERVLVEVWTLRGTTPRPWAAVSLWRGLDLLARLFERPDDGTHLIAEHVRQAAFDLEVAPPFSTAAQPTGLVPWPDDQLEDASRKLAKEIADWWQKSPGEVDRGALRRQIQGLTIERDLLNRLATIADRRPAHRWGGGTSLCDWIEILELFFGDVGLRGWLKRCPLILPLHDSEEITELQAEEGSRSDTEGREILSKAEHAWSLSVEPSSEDGDGAGERIDLDHKLSPKEVLDLLIPADTERYFARFRKRLQDVNVAEWL